MNRSDLVARIATAERQLPLLREELEKEDKHRYYLDEVRSLKDGHLWAAVIRDRSVRHPQDRRKHYPGATVDVVGSLTEERVLCAANLLLEMYRSSER